jgi:hypothetical protein
MTATGIPDLKVTGGAAGPSSAASNTKFGNVFVYSANGGMFWISLAAIAGFILWKFKRR